MTFSKSVKWILIAAVLVAGALFARRTFFKPADKTVYGTVTKRDLVQRVSLAGKIVPRRRADIKAPFAGYIEKLYVKVGDRVKTGDPLVTFSPSLGRGEANFPVRAAFPGVVTQTLRTEGEYSTENDTKIVLRVEDVSELSVIGNVAELDVAKVKIGQEAVVGVSSLVGESFHGKITEISLSAKDVENNWSSSSSAEFQVRASLDSKDPRLLPGMSVLLDIVTQSADGVLTLQHEYIQEENGASFATTADGERRPIELGLRTDEAVEIRKGLSEGDRVRAIDFLELPKVED